MKTYLIEARWYSPTSYEIYHYGLAEVEADSSTEAYEKAAEVFKRHGKTLKMGPEPVSFRIVGPGHQYGKGYDPRVDKVLKENPISKSLPRRAPDSELVDWDWEYDKPKGTNMNIANPLSLRGKEAVIGIGLAAGIGAAIYYMSRPAAAAAKPTTTSTTSTTTTSTTTGAPTPGTITLSPGPGSPPSTVPLSVTIPLGGLYIALPPGGVWTGSSLMASATSNSAPIFIPNTTGPAQTSLAQTLTWTDASGTPQFTSLTTTTTAP